MSPEEMELARSLLATVQNTTVQGWDILVRGTVINNIINLASVLLSLAASLIAGYHRYSHDESSDRQINALIVAFVAFMVCAVGFGLLVGQALLGATMPEYTVLNRIINAASGC